MSFPGTQTDSNLPFGFFPEPRFMAWCIYSIYINVNIFLVFFTGKAVYMKRHAQSARTRSKSTAHRRGREISPGIGRRAGAGRLPEPFTIHPGRHHRKIIARRHFPSQGTGFAAASNWKKGGRFLQEPLSDPPSVRLCVEREGRFKKGCGFRTEVRLKVRALLFLRPEAVQATVAKEAGQGMPIEKQPPPE